MKKFICILLCLILSQISSCGSVQKGQPLVHQFKPFVYSNFNREAFGEDIEKSIENYCKAVMKGQTEFNCQSQSFDTLMIINNILPEVMPIGAEYAPISSISSDHIGHIEYTIPTEDFLSKLDEFQKMVTEILDECCKDGYSDLDNALALYDYIVKNYEYDYTLTVHSSYQFLRDKIGVCQDMTGAYNYLLGQIGMEGISCVCYAHVWSLVNIDGKYYHVDPTFGISQQNALRYFGMTDETREKDNYMSTDYVLTFNSVSYQNKKYRAIDDRFSLLADSTDYSINYIDSTITYTSQSTGKEEKFIYNK